MPDLPSQAYYHLPCRPTFAAVSLQAVQVQQVAAQHRARRLHTARGHTSQSQRPKMSRKAVVGLVSHERGARANLPISMIQSFFFYTPVLISYRTADATRRRAQDAGRCKHSGAARITEPCFGFSLFGSVSCSRGLSGLRGSAAASTSHTSRSAVGVWSIVARHVSC